MTSRANSGFILKGAVSGVIAPKIRRWDILASWVRLRGYQRGVEVGVKTGAMFLQMLQRCPTLTWIGVDLFEPRPELEGTEGESNVQIDFPGHEANLRRIIAEHCPDRGVLLKGLSTEIVTTFPDGSLDLVFIDADHREFAVREDILAWLPKVRSGGTLSGHDYQRQYPGVIAAVDSVLPTRRLFEDSVWEWRVL